MKHQADALGSKQGGRWYQQPILWLGLAILLASLAGCVSLIVLGARYGEEPFPVEAERLLKVPTSHSTDSRPTEATSPQMARTRCRNCRVRSSLGRSNSSSGTSASTMRPPSMKATRSANCFAKAIS